MPTPTTIQSAGRRSRDGNIDRSCQEEIDAERRLDQLFLLEADGLQVGHRQNDEYPGCRRGGRGAACAPLATEIRTR
jgi:hypothetical protein